jgi:hypothetical protein
MSPSLFVKDKDIDTPHKPTDSTVNKTDLPSQAMWPFASAGLRVNTAISASAKHPDGYQPLKMVVIQIVSIKTKFYRNKWLLSAFFNMVMCRNKRL